MAQVLLQGNVVNTAGDFPEIGQPAPAFTLVRNDMVPMELHQFKENNLLINVFPSLDTALCAQSIKTFHDRLQNTPGLLILAVSMDLPFAMTRFMAQTQIQKVVMLSDFRNRQFGMEYGMLMIDGPMAGLLARGVFIVDKEQNLIYKDIAPDISQPVNSEAAFELIATLK